MKRKRPTIKDVRDSYESGRSQGRYELLEKNSKLENELNTLKSMRHGTYTEMCKTMSHAMECMCRMVQAVERQL